MDIRVAAYNPSVTVSTVSRSTSAGATATTTYVQNAAQSGPVQAVNNVPRTGNQFASATEGYTDSVRGSLVNILA